MCKQDTIKQIGSFNIYEHHTKNKMVYIVEYTKQHNPIIKWVFEKDLDFVTEFVKKKTRTDKRLFRKRKKHV